MSLETPTTAEINANIIAQLEAELGQTIPLLPKSFLRVLAKTLAGVFILLYKYGGFIFLQLFVRTASISETDINGRVISPLIEWGRLIGVGDPFPAVNAELLITITVENQTGTLPTGTQLLNADNGVTYVTIGEVVLDAATKQATIRAVEDQAGGGGAGALGNLDDGAIVSFANPLPNVARAAVVDSTVTTGVDAETEDAYRIRIITRFQQVPQGGARVDYQIWGTEPESIINAYPYASEDCPGAVDVYFESGVQPDGIPTVGEIQEGLDAIELDEAGLATRRPITALVRGFPIERVEFTVEIYSLDVSNPATVQAQIEAALTDYFLSREPFLLGTSIPPRRDIITRTGAVGVVEDIVTAQNGIFTSVLILKGGLQTDIYTLDVGEKAKMTSISFI